MTTILWDGSSRTLASDTLIVGENGTMAHAHKFFIRQDGIVAVAGYICGLNAFNTWIDETRANPDKDVKFPKVLKDCDCIYLDALNDQVVVYEGIGSPSVFKFDGIYGWGTGGATAQAFAMAGYSPVEAVRMAATVDMYTGDEVEVATLQRLYRNP